MIKRLATAMALGAMVSLSVPSGVLSSDFTSLTELQQELVSYKAIAVADPIQAHKYFKSWGLEMAVIIPGYGVNEVDLFADCIADRYTEFFSTVPAVTLLNNDDDTLFALISNEAFDAGALCAYEVHQEIQGNKGVM